MKRYDRALKIARKCVDESNKLGQGEYVQSDLEVVSRTLLEILAGTFELSDGRIVASLDVDSVT